MLDLSHTTYNSSCTSISQTSCSPDYMIDLDQDEFYYNLAGYVSQAMNCRFGTDQSRLTVNRYLFYPLLRLERENQNLSYDGDIVLKFTGAYNMLDFFNPGDELKFNFTLGVLPDLSGTNSWSSGYYNTCSYDVKASDDREIRIPVKELFDDENDYNQHIGEALFLHLDVGAKELYTFDFFLKPSLPKVKAVESIPAKCSYDTNGGFKLTFERNLAPGEEFQLFWKRENSRIVSALTQENGQWVYYYTGIPAGTDTIRIAGNSGSDSTLAIAQEFPNKTITVPNPLTYSITAKKDSVCYGATDGSVTFKIEGGTLPYTLYWKKDNVTQTSRTVNSSPYTLSNLGKGVYSYYFKDTNDCQSGNGSLGNDERTVEIYSPVAILAIDTISTVKPMEYGGDGEININVTGGFSPYVVTYRYNEGAESSPLSSPYRITGKAGLYAINAKDKLGCTISRTFTLQQPAQLTINSINRTQSISCAGEEDGALTASVSGGVQPYDYEWSYKATTSGTFAFYGTGSTISNLKSRIYQLTVTDKNGISKTSSDYILTEPAAITISNKTKQDVSCYGGNNGSVRFNIAGGTGNYTVYYKKEPDGVEQSVSVTRTSSLLNRTSLQAGVYSFLVKDGNNCELDVGEIEITEPDELLTIREDERTEATNGKSDGFIRAMIAGGVPPYTIDWRNSSNSIVSTVTSTTAGGVFKTTAANLPKGIYTLTVRDNVNCNQSEVFVLDERPLFALTTERTDNPCNGDSKGKIIVHATGGLKKSGDMPYAYAWYKYNNTTPTLLANETDSVLSNIPVGKYEIQVKDSLNEVISSVVNVLQPDSLKAATTGKNISCYGGNDGTITFQITGGTAPYTVFYQNTETETTYHSTTSNTQNLIISNLMKGVHKLYITDVNNCQGWINELEIATVELTQPAKALTITSERFYGTTGPGMSDGRILIDVDGGTPPYTFEWKNSSGTILPSTEATEGDGIRTTITNLPVDNYTLTVKDANYTGTSNACFITQTYTVVQIIPLEVSVEAIPVDCYGNATGKVIAHAKFGLPYEAGLPYHYTWYQVDGADEILLVNQTDSILSNRPIGTYKVKVEDTVDPANVVTAMGTITQPTPLATNVTTGNISCFDGNDGKIQVEVSGGTGIYQLFYRKMEESSYQSAVWNTTRQAFILTSLVSGSYKVYVKDSNGCIAPINSNDTAVIVLTQPAQPLQIVSAEPIDLSGYKLSNGKISVILEGGTPPYSISWKDSKNNPVSFTETSDAGQTITQLSGLPVDDYTLTVKDANYYAEGTSCVLHQTYTITQPDSLIVSLSSTLSHILCYNDSTGNITAHATGGVRSTSGLPYNYQWSKIGENEMEIPLATADSVLTILRAGKYKVVVTDFSYIPNTITSKVFEITQSEELETTVVTRNVSCYQGNDAFIQIKIQGGVRPYICFYRQNDVDPDYKTLVLETSDASDAFVMDYLTAGDYSVFILDKHNCYAQIDGKDISTIQIEQPVQALQISQTGSINPSGYGRSDGELFVEITGGTPPYIVYWKNAQGNTLGGQGSTVAGVFRHTLSSQFAGDYSVEVYDSNYAGATPETNSTCMDATVFTLTQPDSLMVSIAETHVVSCNGMSDGELTLTATGGIPRTIGIPYQYQWYVLDGSDYVAMQGQTRDRLENIPAGSYRVQVTDYSRMPNTTLCDFILVQPDVLTTVTTQKEIDCGQTTPLSVSVTGGTPPYRYYWSTGDSTQSIASVGPGKYFVLVRDSRDCETTALANIQSPSDLNITGSVAHPTCYQASNGSVTTQISGGRTPYTYKWSNGSVSKNLENVKAGFYTLTVSDAARCSYTNSFELIDPPALSVELGENRTLCAGQEATLIPVVSDPNVRYSWTGPNNFNATNAQITVKTEGTYKVTVTNANGCPATAQVDIKVNDVEINSEIVISSHVYVGDTVVIVNISNPQPDLVEWLLPASDSLIVLEQSEHLAKVWFDSPGVYAVGIRAHIGDCYQDLIKTITALPAGERDRDSFGESLVQKFNIYPNPNNGIFTVDVELSREAAIRLRIVNVGNGMTASDKHYGSDTEFSIPYQLVLPSGIYAVLLEMTSGYLHVKMIVN